MRTRSLFFSLIVSLFFIFGTLTIWRHQFVPSSVQNRSPLSIVPIEAKLPPVSPSPLPDPCENIYKLVCQNRGITHDPTGLVRPDVQGEKEALRLYEEIIHEHRDWNSEQIDEELVQQIFNPKRRERLESAFQWVEHSMEKFINRQVDTVLTKHEKHQLISRLKRTKLQLPPPAATYSDEPDLFTKNEVYFERVLDGELRLRVGGAYVFVAKSWFNQIFTFAHELAHTIDPCEIRFARMAFPAYDHLNACFLESHLIATPNTRMECGSNDQLSETFADWMAAQITADALTSFSAEFRGQDMINAVRNSVRDLCDQEDEIKMDTQYHPTPQVRIENIFGHNPIIRHLLGCEPKIEKSPYCSFEEVLK